MFEDLSETQHLAWLMPVLSLVCNCPATGDVLLLVDLALEGNEQHGKYI